MSSERQNNVTAIPEFFILANNNIMSTFFGIILDIFPVLGSCL